MCFSNLPVEFDENGDPYLADDADAITHPGDEDSVGDGTDGCACVADADLSLDEAPEEAYDAILASVPETARSHLTSATGAESDADSDDRHGRDSAESD